MKRYFITRNDKHGRTVAFLRQGYADGSDKGNQVEWTDDERYKWSGRKEIAKEMAENMNKGDFHFTVKAEPMPGPIPSEESGELKNYQEESEHEKKFPVTEMFGPTIQGEGRMAGTLTYFIRFGGCDYRCKMCDTMHSVLPERVKELATWLTAEQLARKVSEEFDPKRAKWINLSGGNPAMWPLGGLLEILKFGGFKVMLETQGSINPNWLKTLDSLTISPKGPGMGERYEPEKLKAMVANTLVVPQVSIKIPVFEINGDGYRTDLDFVAQVRGQFPELPLYISQGNSYFHIDDEDGQGMVPRKLRKEFHKLLEAVYDHPSLTDIPVLPQLHTWLWGNKLKV